MRIVVIEGSPHRDGSSNMLAREFIRGAEGAGHTVRVFDAAHSRIGPCRGCDACGMSGPCVQKDDMAAIREALLDSDMVVFVTPLYYFGMSAQIKAVIDRFYAFNGLLMSKHLKAALICAAWNSDDWTMRDVSAHYGTICRYLGFEDVGQVLAVGCGTPGMTERSPFMRDAFELGSGLREREDMCQTSCADGDRTIVSGMTLDGERALYGLSDAVVEGCRFAGPADGESGLKECRRISVSGCGFDLRYPLWHADGFSMSGCTMSETCRAALWYDRDGKIEDCTLGGPKALRECSDVALERCRISSPEFGWKCRGITMRDCELESEYPFLDCEDLAIDGLRMRAKYSFQYVRGAVIRNSDLSTKDALWHSRDVTVEDSVIGGEYLGWYSENLTLVRCRISGTQPLCYCRNLRLIDCTMEGADLAFERSDVRADVRGHIDSVKNPLSGWIRADDIGEIICDGSVDCGCEIRTGIGETTPACPTATVVRRRETAPGTALPDSQTLAGSISNPLIPTAVLS